MMKQILAIIICVLFFEKNIDAQNIGIGTSTPKAAFNVAADITVLFGDDTSGGGSKLIWYPSKAAFRAGNIPDNKWDALKVGQYSIALGFRSIAEGVASLSIGDSTSSFGQSAVALGYKTNAEGGFTTALGAYSSALGYCSIATGNSTFAGGYCSNAMGYYSKTEGGYSSAIGANLNAKSGFETVIGRFNTIYTPSSFYDWVPTDRLFTIGNGTGPGEFSSDAMVILKNGNTGFGSSSPQAYGHGGTNKIVEIRNDSTGSNIQSQLILSTDGTSGALGGLTWAAPNVPGNEKRAGFIGSTFQSANQTKISLYTRSNAGNLVESFYVKGDGNAWLQGTLTQNSDERLKTNIAPIQNSLDALLQLTGYTYNWKDKNLDNSLQTGVLAQEVQKIFPHLVKTAVDGTLSVNYNGLIPVMIESIKEQQKQIENLTQKVNKLTSKYLALKKG